MEEEVVDKYYGPKEVDEKVKEIHLLHITLLKKTNEKIELSDKLKEIIQDPSEQIQNWCEMKRL